MGGLIERLFHRFLQFVCHQCHPASLAFVYWPSDTVDAAAKRENYINLITLAGSAVGMLLFGFLADKLGRKKLYGVELVIVIFGTLGVVQCSAGYNQQSMDIEGWMMFW